MHTRVVILAAGQGKRMKSELPKVLTPLNGKPLIDYVTAAVAKSGVDARPVIVVGVKAEMVKKHLGDNFDYAYQSEQLGTGHAVAAAEPILEGKADAVLVLYGDQPFVAPETILRLARTHVEQGSVLTMATTHVEDFDQWRQSLYDFGRVIRNENGEIVDVIELKDASEEVKTIKELNPSLFCFTAGWLWDNLKRLENKNVQKEYYLVDLVRIAMNGGNHIASIDINPLETIGINNPDHLELAGQFAANAR